MAPGLKVLGVRVTKPKIPEAIRWDLLLALSSYVFCNPIIIIYLKISIQEELRVDGGREDKVDDFNPKAEGECPLELKLLQNLSDS